MNEQQRAVVQWALEAFTTLRGACAAAGWLTDSEHIDHKDNSREAITALRQLLEQPEQEPVWIQPDHLQKAKTAPFLCRVEPHKRDDFVPLYTTPPAQPAVPEGWKPVPVVPTERMVEAGLKAFEKRATSPTRAAWKAMLSAAPTQGEAK